MNAGLLLRLAELAVTVGVAILAREHQPQMTRAEVDLEARLVLERLRRARRH